jgi:hypothetical protein
MRGPVPVSTVFIGLVNPAWLGAPPDAATCVGAFNSRIPRGLVLEVAYLDSHARLKRRIRAL